jgi:type IV secretion system protein TrbJ
MAAFGIHIGLKKNSTKGNKMKKNIMITLAVAFLCLPISAQSLTVTCTNCSDKFTQMLERVTNIEQLAELQKVYNEAIVQTAQQIEMVRQNIEQYKNMVQNTLQLPQTIINEIAGELSKLAQITAQLETLRNDAKAMADIFDKSYLDTSAFKDWSSLQRANYTSRNQAIRKNLDTMSEEVDRSTKATFQLSGQQLSDLSKTGELENYINKLLSTPEGQQQALMAGNQLAALQIQESRQLRELLATRAQSDLSSQLKKEKKEQLSEEIRRKLFDMELNTSPVDDPF